MVCTLAAILGRFNGDRKKAQEYCIEVATTYPALAKEYWSIYEKL